MGKKKKNEPEMITATELARRLGVTEPAVRKAAKGGRIIPAAITATGRKLFIESVAREQWAANTTAEKRTGRARVAGADGARDDSNVLSAAAAKALKDSADAEIRFHKLRQLKGELVELKEVERLWEEHVSHARQLFLALPIDLQLHIPDLTSDDAVIITERIHSILDTLSEWEPKQQHDDDGS